MTPFTIDPVLEALSVSQILFVGLETGCSDSDQFDNFTLTCSARKPQKVLSELLITWYHDGVEIPGSVTLSEEEILSNKIVFTHTESDNSGTYNCIAELLIPHSTTIENIASSNVTLRGMNKCFMLSK